MKIICSWLFCFISLFEISGQIKFDQKSTVLAANDFISSLTETQKSLVLKSWSDSTRKIWSNFPSETVTRYGLKQDELTDIQRIKLHSLLRTVLSEQGYQKVLNIMQYDGDTYRRLKAMNSPIFQRYGQEKYWISIFNSPDLNKLWAFKFEGHHLSLNLTFSQKGISVTPHFIGINPALTEKGENAGKYLLMKENETGKDLFASLNAVQMKKALLDTLPFSIDPLTQTGREPHLKDGKGLPYSEMNIAQRKIVEDLLSAWLDNFHPLIAAEKKRTINKNLNTSRFVWLGTESVNKLHYYRIQAPGWIIEMANRDQGMQHTHSLWRMLSEDFGALVD